jgi:threonine/homoserine/homoserine lactone efflux protein
MGIGAVLGGLIGAAPVLGLAGAAYLAACGVAMARAPRPRPSVSEP